MDAKVTWNISPKVETLLDVIVECRKQLFDIIKKRHPYSRSLKLRYCDAHASPKLVQLLAASDTWRDYKETSDDMEVRRMEKFPYSQKMVADFEMFKVIEDALVGDSRIRVVAEFDTGGGEWEVFYGNIELV